MKLLMTKLLHLKHWQLFLLLIGVPFLGQIITVGSFMGGDPSNMMIAFPLLMILYVTLHFGWLYTLGTQLYKKLPASVSMNLTLFKVFMFLPVAYILFIMLAMAYAFNAPGTTPETVFGFAGIIVPIHLFSMFCIFYCMYFIAKVLKSVEWQRPVTFGDYAGEFFLIWFFPIGIWILQPRINRLFDERSDLDLDFLNQPS
jgi:hypothetical protein